MRSIEISPRRPRRSRRLKQTNGEKIHWVPILKEWPDDDDNSSIHQRTLNYQVRNQRKDFGKKDECKKKFKDAVIPTKVLGTPPVRHKVPTPKSKSTSRRGTNSQFTTILIHDEADFGNHNPRMTRIRLPSDVSGEELGALLRQSLIRGFRHFVHDDVFCRAVLHWFCSIYEAA